MIKGTWLYGRKLLIVCNHSARFGSHRYCGSGDKMFLIYHVTSRNHAFKGLCDLMGWICILVCHDLTRSCDYMVMWFYEKKSLKVSHYPATFVAIRIVVVRDTMFLVCQLVSQNSQGKSRSCLVLWPQILC